jgi:hypothetical protein
MAVTITVGAAALEVRLTDWDKLVAMRGAIDVAYDEIVDARVASLAQATELRGWRVGGTYVPGRIATGNFLTRGQRNRRQFWSVYRDTEVLLIETRGERPWRVVLQTPQRHDLAAALQIRMSG